MSPYLEKPLRELADVRRETRLVECMGCHGERGYGVAYGIDRNNGAVLEHWYRCEVCDGSGENEIEVFPIIIEDLPS